MDWIEEHKIKLVQDKRDCHHDSAPRPLLVSDFHPAALPSYPEHEREFLKFIAWRREMLPFLEERIAKINDALPCNLLLHTGRLVSTGNRHDGRADHEEYLRVMFSQESDRKLSVFARHYRRNQGEQHPGTELIITPRGDLGHYGKEWFIKLKGFNHSSPAVQIESGSITKEQMDSLLKWLVAGEAPIWIAKRKRRSLKNLWGLFG